MSEMVDRVANAILQAEAIERGIPAEWSDLNEELQAALRLQARAAIQAMGDPTDRVAAAIRRGIHQVVTIHGGEVFVRGDAGEHVATAMVEAAFQEVSR